MMDIKEFLKIIVVFCLIIGIIISQICLFVFGHRYLNAREGGIIACVVFFSNLLTTTVFYLLVRFEIWNKNSGR